jgi:hypothetical protein
MKVKVEAQTPEGFVKGSKKLFLRDEFRMEFEILTELRSKPEGVVIVLKSIDLNSLKINPEDLTWAGRLVSGQVLKGVQDELKEVNLKWAQTENIMPGALPLPPEVLGIQSKIVSLNFEESGQLVLYLAYTDRSDRSMQRRPGL